MNKISGKEMILDQLRDGWSLRWTDDGCAGVWHLVKGQTACPVHGVTGRSLSRTVPALRTSDPEDAEVRTWRLDPAVAVESENERKNRVAREKRAAQAAA